MVICDEDDGECVVMCDVDSDEVNIQQRTLCCSAFCSSYHCWLRSSSPFCSVGKYVTVEFSCTSTRLNAVHVHVLFIGFANEKILRNAIPILFLVLFSELAVVVVEAFPLLSDWVEMLDIRRI